MKIIAKTLTGLELVLKKEIEDLGGSNIELGKRAVVFEGDLELLYKANLHLRTALRLLVTIAKFEAKDEIQLYENAKKIDWFQYLELKQTFSIDTNVNSEIFTHSKYVAYKVKDAIADVFTEKKGRRPNVNTYQPNVKFNVRIFNSMVEISLDSSGESLHLRGYKVEGLEAPLSEVLAAGILLQTNFKAKNNFWDPMCGSGTLISEALMIDTNMAPNAMRDYFGFMGWSNYQERLWTELKKEAQDKISKPSIKFVGTDISRKAVFATKRNLSLLPYGNEVEIYKKDFFKSKEGKDLDFIIMNPPYDIRLKEDEIVSFYKNIGDKLKQECAPCDAWIFSGNIPVLKQFGLKPSKKIKMMNGKLDAELRKFEIYNSKKSSY